MGQVIQALLDTVLEFYRGQGVPLGYRPTVEQVSSDCMREMELVARIGVEIAPAGPDQPSLSRLFARTRSAALWRRVLGLDVSREAIEELNRIVQARRVLRSAGDSKADIILYPSFTGSAIKPWYIAHEVWHLIEDERGLLAAEPIREGTATFAAALHLGKTDDELFLRPPGRCGDLLSLRRAGVGHIVKEHLGRSARPLVEMLRPAVRAQVQEDALQRCQPLILALAREAAEDPDYVEDFTRYLRRTLSHVGNGHGSSPDGVVAAYRQIGALRLAEELARQDLTRLVTTLAEAS